MNVAESQGLLKSVLGRFFQRRPENSPQPASFGSRAPEAWLQTETFLHHHAYGYGKPDPEHTIGALRTLEEHVQCNPEMESNSVTVQGFCYNIPDARRRAARSMSEQGCHDAHSSSGTVIRVRERKRDSDAVRQDLSHLSNKAKKRRVLPREEPIAADSLEDLDVDFLLLMRRHLISLDNALQKHWKNDFNVETSFEASFGVRSPVDTALQEAKITIKNVHSNRLRSASEPTVGCEPDCASICHSITESFGQQNCLHFALEDGIFQRLRPQPKAFGGEQMSRTVSLSALFHRQQELRGGSSALPLLGKRTLAVTLATALLPFLETPWLQPSFNHSNILFVEPLQDGELPDITKPFLATERIPLVAAGKTVSRVSSDSSKHMVHPNATVLALGILLCELHYCTPVQLMQKDQPGARNVNSDYYTSLNMLKSLEFDAGVDYYLATKACLQWEYYPPGQQQADFDSVDVQRLFYQNVIKRLESDIFKSWGLRLQDLSSFDRRRNELCWGPIGQEVVRHQTGKVDHSAESNGARAQLAHRSISDAVPVSNSSLHSDVLLPMPGPAQASPQTQHREHPVEPSMKSLYFFDASHQMGPEQETPLSRQWMDNLQSSICRHIDPFDAAEARRRAFKPVRIAILDSGFDPRNPLLITEDGRLDPRIKDARSFIKGTASNDIRDEIGHGTHALGLLLNLATCAEIYIARVANRESLDRNTYDDITKAINHAVSEWKVDIISTSFGVREYNAPMAKAISNALNSQTLVFAAASNDGANFGRAFPAKHPSVFCIHSTDGHGNPSSFNPTADDKGVNFGLLGEHVSSHWPMGLNGHNEPVKAMSGTSIATPIAAGLAAAILSFVRQQEEHMAPGPDLLAPWLKDFHSMDAVLKSMVKQRRGGYDYIMPHSLLDRRATREAVYDKIKDIRRHLYD